MGKMFQRAYGVLQADKAVMSEECKRLILRDLQGKLSEYFELSSPLSIEIEEEKGTYRVLLSFDAERIKHFQVLK